MEKLQSLQILYSLKKDNMITTILEIAGLIISAILITYILSRVQVFAWLHGLNRFLTNKFENNEQKEKK